MVEVVFNIVSESAIAIITGITTFLITRYTCNRNRPLDKLEIAYNRFYYPVLKMMKDKEMPEKVFIETCDYYIKKYDKYVDGATIRAFNDYKNTKSVNACKKFKDNIYENKVILRKKLGYLESGIYTNYKYASVTDKRTLKLMLAFMLLYIVNVIYHSVNISIIKDNAPYLMASMLIVVIYQLISMVISLIYNKFIEKK